METEVTEKIAVNPFDIHVPEDVLTDLRHRLKRTRWIEDLDDGGWKHGVSLNYLKEFVQYWMDSYNWRAQEEKLNLFNQYRAMIEDCDIHFIHEKSDHPDAIPILLLHGWPDSFYRFHKIIPMLTDQSFDVVVPSQPGFGFTHDMQQDEIMKPIQRSARLMHTLMTDVLGYNRFIAVGGDGGSPLAQRMAIDNPGSLIGIYLNDLGWSNTDIDPSTMSAKEKKYFDAKQKEFMKESAYVMVHATKPQTLSYSLADSPVGLASWILDRFYFWCDCKEGDIEASFSRDDLITNIMIYWVTNTIGSSIRGYRTETKSPSLTSKDRVDVPVGLGLFPKDIGGIPPRELAERTLNVVYWNEMPRGGHFTAWEEPNLMAEDIVSFVKKIREIK